ncbi:MAG: hypothetical protein J5866_00135 [Aeriscardovia sp.]|nr:hypothetical protein [Aeriscardovia sp.]MBQ9687536.1 hypothetical protein [Aeriscardovia sp.]
MHYFVPQRCPQSNKIKYKNKDQALTAAEQCSIKQNIELTIYQCQYCGTWHLTHHVQSDYSWFKPSEYSRKPVSRKRGYKPRRH